jgi:hypothetical protein
MDIYTAACVIDGGDTITAARSGDRVELEPSSRTEVYLDPAPARTFARGILALADEIDGGEVKEEAPAVKPVPQVGDRVSIVEDDSYSMPGEFIGRTGVLREAKTDGRGMPYRVRLDDPSGTWDEGSWWVKEVELLDEETPADTPVNPFAAHVDEAKRLLADTDHNGADVIRLARELADRA